MSNETILGRLEEVILSRMRERPENSYVARLIEGGHAGRAAKIMEEARELVEAAAREQTDGDAARPAVIHEAADVLFHLLVLLAAAGVTLQDVESELQRRFGTGGLQEKASRD